MPQKLAIIDDLFPREIIAQRIERHRRLWAGQAIDRPLITPVSWKHFYRNIVNPQRTAEKFAAALAAESAAGYDTIPAFGCVLGTCALASAFGGALHQEQEDGVFWIEPIVHEPEDVDRLGPPSGPLAGLVGKSVELYRYALDHIDGYIPPRVPDMQGPLNTAAMIWQQDQFMMAMYESPKSVHRLLDLVTDHIVTVYRYFRDTWPQANLMTWPYMYMPTELGVGMVEDFMHLMSPQLYEEFGLPYVNRIAREFGGVFIHCCGAFSQHYPLVRQFHNLRGLDTMYPLSHPDTLFAAFPDIVHVMGVSYAESVRTFDKQGPDAFLEFLLAHRPPNLRAAWFANPDDAETFRRQVDRITEAGNSGQQDKAARAPRTRREAVQCRP